LGKYFVCHNSAENEARELLKRFEYAEILVVSILKMGSCVFELFRGLHHIWGKMSGFCMTSSGPGPQIQA